ncbi:MAG: glycosyltransferase [Frankiaceae bacterium]|nr:glycosyltransferase [Frankiaceae bacterium]MBV9869194.1 glycosyltransferase [Frankiaceae bacterium]
MPATTTDSPVLATDSASPHAPTLDIVVPVYNEACDLEPCIRRLHRFISHDLPLTARITIADNASTDDTWQIASALAAELSTVHAIHLDTKGRGRALHAAWGASDATVLAYMDVDLSTDLAALLPLVAPLLSGHSDLAIGTRLTHSARVVRGPKRELVSRVYNTFLHATLRTRFSDAQCGFKAIRRDRAQLLLPLVEDNEWFFDTELLVLAERSGLRIHEVPVDWTDDPDSRVDVVATAIADLKGVARLGCGLAAGRIPLAAVAVHARRPLPASGATRQVLRFASIGLASTALYLLLYVGLRSAMPAIAANGIALLLSAVANTAANRRLTFGVVTPSGALRHHLQALVVFAVALGMTSGALGLLRLAAPRPSPLLEVATLIAANLGATAVRFVLLRGWVFKPDSQEPHRS